MRITPVLPCLLLAVAFASCSGPKQSRRAETPLPSYQLRLADDIVFEIDPRLELLAGVQSQTSWVRGDRGPAAANRYYDQLKARFAPLAKGRAARESQWLANTSFSYDAPCAMAMSLDGGEAFEAPAEGWSDYLKGRAWGGWRLDSFREALAEAYDESKFRDFLAAHEEDYRRWLAEESAGFDGAKISAWLRGFYGAKGDIEFHFVFAPAMFPGGGYGFSRSVVKDGKKRLEVYQIVRAQGAGDGNPGFPSGDSLGSLALHEFGHSFVNPALEKGSSDSRLARMLKPVSKVMARQAYTNVSTFLNEMTIRAATIAGERELGMISDEGAATALGAERRIGFYPIRRAFALLGEYEAQRDRYPDFASFAPVYLGRLASDADAIIAEGAKDDYGSTAAKPIPTVDSFDEGFEGKAAANGLPEGFALDVGAQIGGGKGGESYYGIDAGAHGDAKGGAALKLEASAGTSLWYCVQKPVAVRKGSLSLSYAAKGVGIRTESGQYGGSYVGFILGYKDGSKRFAVQMHSGSFDWQGFTLAEGIDPSKVSSIMFTAFLNESGALWVDDISVAYK